ncbi:hypothetical protein GCM10010405_44520 [Streptomyces macrosporus]|uniref:Uncharacterized protein n=1 Tax=Streptomyces macrosporus TaxID=44032 RepID=A0ABP5XM97_9ACTN
MSVRRGREPRAEDVPPRAPDVSAGVGGGPVAARGGAYPPDDRRARYVRIFARLPQTAMVHQRLRPAGLLS